MDVLPAKKKATPKKDKALSIVIDSYSNSKGVSLTPREAGASLVGAPSTPSLMPSTPPVRQKGVKSTSSLSYNR